MPSAEVGGDSEWVNDITHSQQFKAQFPEVYNGDIGHIDGVDPNSQRS